MIVCNDILNIIYCFLIINNYYYIQFHWLKLLLNIVAKQISDEMACALRLFDVKSRCNLTDKAFQQTIIRRLNKVWICKKSHMQKIA